MPKRRGKSAASKQQKTPKSEIKGAVLISTRYVDGATRSKTDDERFCHNKKKLERALNAKIICKEDDKEDQSQSKTGDERFHHNKKKLERALNAKIICKENDKEEQDDAAAEEQDDDDAIMKKLDKLFNPPSGCNRCKDRTNYTRGMKIVFSAYVL